MKTQQLVRIAGLAALALVALAAISYLFAGREPRAGALPDDETIAIDGGEEVMASIDQALGRPGLIEVAPFSGAEPPLPADAALGVAVSQNATKDVAPGGGAPAALASIDDRKIVQTAALRLQVDAVGASFEDVGRIATAAGGFVASSNFSFQGDRQVASLTVRVPATRYQDVLSQVRALGAKVDSEVSNASDVTEEYSDLQARLRNLEATEGQLLALLGRAETITDILQVQDRLNFVRGQIEQSQGRMALLDKLTDLATITVRLRPVVVGATSGGGDLGASVSKAWNDSLQFLGGVAAGVLTVVIFGWWTPIVAVPTYVLGSRLLRNRPRPAVTPVEGV